MYTSIRSSVRSFSFTRLFHSFYLSTIAIFASMFTSAPTKRKFTFTIDTSNISYAQNEQLILTLKSRRGWKVRVNSFDTIIRVVVRAHNFAVASLIARLAVYQGVNKKV